jgi:hypothetical protein
VLRPFRLTYKGKRYSLLIAQLGTDAPDVKLGRRAVRLELHSGTGWRMVGYQSTDGGGRAVWEIPRGRYRIRATLGKSADLKPAVSRPITVRG